MSAMANERLTGRRILHAARWGWQCANALLVSEAAGDEAANAVGWRTDEEGEYCRRCGGSTGEGEATDSGCAQCRGEDVAWDGVWRLGSYDGALAQWIVAMKFGYAWAWGPWFGKQLAERIAGEREKENQSVVTYVPLHWRRRLTRGFDQSRLIAAATAKESGLPLARLLRRRRATRQQSLVRAKADRVANVRQAFAAADVDLTGWTVWLVDDVTTTGATAGQCAKLLRGAGAKAVYLAVAAVTDVGQSRGRRAGSIEGH